ncbi:hypothetical protein CLV51_11116 [Chitinophaga niastensis]|uniref:Lipoprotein n=1 Tax=Chitinophaga niastensis TaxID=536980 RepID=A0A2P8H8V9_CHINA|nr:hypothetical protein [Chitinophaga niastensis]PSL42631.1 hypothetical protein CLV51_11116 [Chitinophaga niastensis]
MKRFLLVILAIGVLAACKSKKKSGHGTDEPMTLEDFQALFTPGTLPYKLTPDTLQLNMPDSLELDTAALRFLTDTLTKGDFSKNEAVQLFPLQRIPGNVVNYMVVEAAGKSHIVGYLCFMNKKGKYLNRIRVANTGSSDGTVASLSLDSKNVIKISSEKKLAGTRSALKEDFYMVNADGTVTLIMTNSNGPTSAGQIFNPIDTLQRKQKFSGDYTSGDMSIVSIRDGDDPKTFQFFITFSKDNGNCKGELSGKGHYIAGNRGEYKDKESSCGISFQFSAGRVSIRETGGCGAYRGIKCFFEGGFVKKVEKKAEKKKKK